MRARVAAVLDVLTGLVLVAWVGGHGALGAFGARIAFRELPRPDAARTMTRVFHEFDRLILVGVVVLAVCALVGLFLRPSGRASSVRAGLELGLSALGLFEVLHVHALIETMFANGQTLSPAFQAAHQLSERCAHGELLLVVGILTFRAWPARG